MGDNSVMRDCKLIPSLMVTANPGAVLLQVGQVFAAVFLYFGNKLNVSIPRHGSHDPVHSTFNSPAVYLVWCLVETTAQYDEEEVCSVLAQSRVPCKY